MQMTASLNRGTRSGCKVPLIYPFPSSIGSEWDKMLQSPRPRSSRWGKFKQVCQKRLQLEYHWGCCQLPGAPLAPYPMSVLRGEVDVWVHNGPWNVHACHVSRYWLVLTTSQSYRTPTVHTWVHITDWHAIMVAPLHTVPRDIPQ